MSLDYGLSKCREDVNTNGKVAERFGEQAMYSLSVLTMVCGVPNLKTAADCEKLYDRGRAIELIPADKKGEWWEFIQAMRGLWTNANPYTDTQFAKLLLGHWMRNGEAERRVLNRAVAEATKV